MDEGGYMGAHVSINAIHQLGKWVTETVGECVVCVTPFELFL